MSKQYIMKNGIAVEVSDEIYNMLKKSDRRIRYVEEDLKQTHYIVNKKKDTTKEIPAREDSLDRLTALGFEFADRTADFDEEVLIKIMLDQALEKLSEEERYLIIQLFYFGRTERNLADELGVYRNAVHSQKVKILKKLKKMLGEKKGIVIFNN